MSNIYKFGSMEGEFLYGNIFKQEVFPEWTRVTIGVDNDAIPLMLDIVKQWNGPYGILYVLPISRLGHECCRYQSPHPCTFDELKLFAYTFQEYFEGDGRHHIWFIDLESNNKLIYDKHNLIYVYGDDANVISLLEKCGFSEKEIQIPSPHQHRYNQEHDVQEDEIMGYFEWKKFPLQSHDE